MSDGWVPAARFRVLNAEAGAVQQRAALAHVIGGDAPGFTDGERSYLKFQFRMSGGFWTQMWEAMHRADPENLARLSLAFPEEVAALRAWRVGDLAQRFERAGVMM